MHTWVLTSINFVIYQQNNIVLHVALMKIAVEISKQSL